MLHEIGEITSFSVVSDDDRIANVIVNSRDFPKRLQDNLPAHNRTAVLVCYGPSLKDTWGEISERPNEDIFTVSGSHRFLTDKGIIPFAHIDCDPLKRKAKQFGKPNPHVKYWMASCVNPYYLFLLEEQDVSLWHINTGKDSEIIWDYEPEAWMLIGGGDVGTCAVSLLYAQGYRKFVIHGMDCSFKSTNERHAGIHLSPKPTISTVVCNNRSFVTNWAFVSYARRFLQMCEIWKGAEFIIRGDGLLQEMIRTHNQEKAA